MTREDVQKLHEELIDFLNSKFVKGSQFKKVPYALSSDKFTEIDIHDINNAVVVLVHTLNLTGGSVSDVDLYELLQVYFRQPDARQKINEIIKETKIGKH